MKLHPKAAATFDNKSASSNFISKKGPKAKDRAMTSNNGSINNPNESEIFYLAYDFEESKNENENDPWGTRESFYSRSDAWHEESKEEEDEILSRDTDFKEGNGLVEIASNDLDNGSDGLHKGEYQIALEEGLYRPREDANRRRNDDVFAEIGDSVVEDTLSRVTVDTDDLFLWDEERGAAERELEDLGIVGFIHFTLRSAMRKICNICCKDDANNLDQADQLQFHDAETNMLEHGQKALAANGNAPVGFTVPPEAL